MTNEAYDTARKALTAALNDAEDAYDAAYKAAKAAYVAATKEQA